MNASPSPPEFLDRWKPEVERALDRLLPPEDEPSGLGAAMRYSVLAGGKRIRPILVLSAYEACGGTDMRVVLEPACALEMFHTYSLVHDDLPAMDDDGLRRGKPTNHVVYGDAMAILAGDALQTLGSEILASRPPGREWAERRSAACREIFDALGWAGMAGGQALDLKGPENDAHRIEDILQIHRMKTGRFLEAALQIGAIFAGAPAAGRRGLAAYGRAVGLAFQVVDDILDVTATTQALGKTAGKDPLQGKATFPAFWGLEGSRLEAERLCREATEALDSLEGDSGDLRALARYIVERGS